MDQATKMAIMQAVNRRKRDRLDRKAFARAAQALERVGRAELAAELKAMSLMRAPKTTPSNHR